MGDYHNKKRTLFFTILNRYDVDVTRIVCLSNYYHSANVFLCLYVCTLFLAEIMSKSVYYVYSFDCLLLEKGSGLEYTMAVTHLPTFNDVMEEESLQCTCCPEAVQRTLATMLDTSLLSSPSFMLLCFGGFFTCMGFYVPFMFIESKFSTLFIRVWVYIQGVPEEGGSQN